MIKIVIDNGHCDMSVSGGSKVIAREILSAIITLYNRLKAHNFEQAQLFKACILLGINHRENWTMEPGEDTNLTSAYIPRPKK